MYVKLSKGNNLTLVVYTSAYSKYTMIDVLIYFMLGSPKTTIVSDSMFVGVDTYFIMVHFLPCKKTTNVTRVSPLFFNMWFDFMAYHALSPMIRFLLPCTLFAGFVKIV